MTAWPQLFKSLPRSKFAASSQLGLLDCTSSTPLLSYLASMSSCIIDHKTPSGETIGSCALSFLQPASKLSKALWGWGGGGEERGTCKLLHLSNLNSTSNSLVAPHQLSGQISTNQGEAEKNANVNKHSKTQAKGK